MIKNNKIDGLLGEVIVHIEQKEINGEIREIEFYLKNGYKIGFYGFGDCANIFLQDICGDFEDLLDNPVLIAEIAKSDMKDSEPEMVKMINKGFDTDASLWTFYKISTIKGSVDLRWMGLSNGHYSVEVDISTEKYELSELEELQNKGSSHKI